MQDLFHNMRPIIFIFVFLSMTALNGQEKSLPSITGKTVKQAIKLCGTEGKLLFIYFHAEWVQPCQWMKTRTFLDPEILAFFNENVIFLELNLESQLGNLEKEHFKVKALPTMILFDASGNQLIRIEEAMNAKKLLSILNTWNVPENRRLKSGNMTDDRANNSFEHLTKPALIPQAGKAIPENELLKYGIIIKYFYQYEQALPYIQQFQSKVEKKVTFIEKILSDELKQYQIIVGEFSSQEEARAYLPQLITLGISGEIIKL